MEKKSFSIREAAEALGVCKATIMRLIREDKLRSIRPSPRRVIIPADALEDYLAGGR